MKNKLLVYIAFITCTLLFPAFYSTAGEMLPDIDGWINCNTRVTQLDTVSGNRGTWLERDYRTTAGILVHAVWIDGAGDKGWNVSDKTISADDGAMGTGATYKTLTVSGEKAALEHHPVTGYSLFIKIGTLGTLTLESKIATEDEILRAGEALTKKIKL